MYYKTYNKENIGSSDIARLIYTAADETTGIIKFLGDGNYNAYIVPAGTEIPEHYTQIADGRGWLRIYDDDGKSWSCGGNNDEHAVRSAGKSTAPVDAA